MKIRIERSEWYPFFTVSASGVECDVPQEKLEEWKRVNADFERVQNELSEWMENQMETEKQINPYGSAHQIF